MRWSFTEESAISLSSYSSLKRDEKILFKLVQAGPFHDFFVHSEQVRHAVETIPVLNGKHS